MRIHTAILLNILFIISFGARCKSSECYKNFSPEEYPSCTQLSPIVSMHWAIVNGTITWGIDVDGAWDWVGIGISEGGMLGADIAVAQFNPDAHNWTAADYWSRDFTNPELDLQQDVSLVYISRQIHNNVNGSTLVVLRRPLVTCDLIQDRPILNDTLQTVVFAYGIDSFDYHGHLNRGQAEVNFLPSVLATEATGSTTPALQSLNLTMPAFTVPTEPTTYQCVNIHLPDDTKYHIYSYEPIIDNEMLVHHFVVYTCGGTSPPPTQVGQPYDCLGYMECETFYMGWAPGLGKVDAPAAAALAFGNGTNARYVTLQIHYTNVHGMPDQNDASGFRISYSSILKEYDMGVLTLGTEGIAVPAGVPLWSTQPNICPSSCTAQLAAPSGPDGIVLVQSFYHMHMLGRSMVTRHIRNGVELPPLGSREFFDFAYQSPVSIPPETRQLFSNDTLITTCTYTGIGRTNTTTFGLASYDEMCYNFLTYYPYNPSITDCIQSWEDPRIASCTNGDVLAQLAEANFNQTVVQAAIEAGQLVLVSDNITYREYQPTCERSVSEPVRGSGGRGSDEDEDDDDDEEEEHRRHKRNVGGAVAAILIVTAAGATAIVVVFWLMKKKRQLEEEQHLFDKYNPNSGLMPAIGTAPINASSELLGGGRVPFSKDTCSISKNSSEMTAGRGGGGLIL